MVASKQPEPLKQLFAGLAEHAFLAEIGIADTPLIDYVADLLLRFVHRDAIYPLRDASGRRLVELAAMLAEAEKDETKPHRRRAIYRHAGDFALFWAGVYPESVGQQRRPFAMSRDALLDYVEQGKRSYYIASTYAETPEFAAQAPILRRLSSEFEACATGLRRVRSHWEAIQTEGPPTSNG